MDEDEDHADNRHVLRGHHPDVLCAGRHNPPHFHAYYNEFRAKFSIDSLELIDGDLPRRQMRLVQAWAELHQDELKADWQLAMNGEEPCRIPPLQ